MSRYNKHKMIIIIDNIGEIYSAIGWSDVDGVCLSLSK